MAPAALALSRLLGEGAGAAVDERDLAASAAAFGGVGRAAVRAAALLAAGGVDEEHDVAGEVERDADRRPPTPTVVTCRAERRGALIVTVSSMT